MTHWEISPLLRTATFSLPTSACEQLLLCAFIGYLFHLNGFRLLIHKPASAPWIGGWGRGRDGGGSRCASVISFTLRSVPSASMETLGILGLCSLLHAGAFPAKIAGSGNNPQHIQSSESICRGERKTQHAAFGERKALWGSRREEGKEPDFLNTSE